MKLLVTLLSMIAIIPISELAKYDLALSKSESKIKILGTSSLHDWEESVEDYSLNASLIDNEIQNLEIEIKVSSIESGKSIMNEKTHEALLAKKHPLIRFTATTLTLNENAFKGTGNLSIAGEQRTISVNGLITESNAKHMTATGNIDLKMTDFGIDPPTAMFGTLTTGNEINISFKFKLMLQQTK